MALYIKGIQVRSSQGAGSQRLPIPACDISLATVATVWRCGSQLVGCGESDPCWRDRRLAAKARPCGAYSPLPTQPVAKPTSLLKEAGSLLCEL
jgi:hypothetical protein